MDWVRKIHKWTSLFVGVQFLLWLGSGIYFNLMDHRKASGHQYRTHLHHETTFDKASLVEPIIVLAQAKAATSIKVTEILGQPYYIVNHEKGLYANFKNRYSLYHAYTGEHFIIDKEVAIELARQSYNGPGDIASAKFIGGKVDDLPKQKNPVWQVVVNDDVNTRIYVEAESGRIAGHSDDDSRFAGIFFMLHFMDYGNEGSFNNIQIMLFAFVTLWLSTTGIIWTVDLAFRGQYKIKWLAGKQTVKLFDKYKQSLGDVKLSTHNNLLHELAEQSIVLPSSCGGGGTCGKCRVLISPNAKVTSADSQKFNQEQLDEGFRLACQHFANDVEHMTLMDITDANKITLELIDNRFISADIKELRFKVLDADFSYKAGAFMRFLIPAGNGNYLPLNIPAQYLKAWRDTKNLDYAFEACSRSYSIANVDEQNGELVFTIKMAKPQNDGQLPGIGSNFMGNLAVNQTIEALGPFEDFYVKPNNGKTIVLVGAGSGMAPLKAIIEEQLALDSEGNVVFIYGARREEDLIYQDEFFQLAKTNRRFTYLPTLSKPSVDWLGAHGYAQEVLEKNIDSFGDINSLDFYLCGPKAMMEETIALLKQRGVKENQVSYDDFT